MQANRQILVLILAILTFTGCVEPYTPKIDESQESLVIEGQITDQAGYHYIRVSRSAPYNDPHEIPEKDCRVEVLDNKGNIFQFYESEPGLYEQWITQNYLTIGTQYKVQVTTADGNEYQSDYDLLLSSCPPVDSIYYEIEIRETSNPYYPIYGIQFYIDLDAPENFARNYRWKLEETWEYVASYTIQYYYDGTTIHEMENPLLLYRCWRTDPIRQIFAATTRYSISNKIKKYPLLYVSNKSNRLKIKYSLLVKQYSLSNEAYDYWDQLKKQSQESGGFYETQPAPVRGNISNINDPEEVVLGFFNASSITEKRIFVSEPFTFPLPGDVCLLDTIGPDHPLDSYTTFPIYLISISFFGFGPPYATGSGICFDCTAIGGTTERPDFWE
jgi:hypothetical protein